MRKTCNKHFVTTCKAEGLIVVLCYQALHRDDEDEEFRRWLGLPPCLYHQHPLLISIGKRAYGQQMDSGGPSSGDFTSLKEFDLRQKSNLDGSPWIENNALQGWDADRDRMREDFRQNLRVSSPWWLHSLPPVAKIPVTRFVNGATDSPDVPENDQDMSGDPPEQEEDDDDLQQMDTDRIDPSRISLGETLLKTLLLPENLRTMAQVHNRRHPPPMNANSNTAAQLLSASPLLLISSKIRRTCGIWVTPVTYHRHSR